MDYINKEDLSAVTGILKNYTDNKVATIKSNHTFPAGWTTNQTMNDLMADIINDNSAVEGMTYLGDVTCSDLPFNGNAELLVYIMNGTTASDKAIWAQLSSGTDSPYFWHYTYWTIGGVTHYSGWRSYIPSDQQNRVFTNTAVAQADWVADNTYTGYNYKASITLNGVTVNDIPEVIFAGNDAVSGNYLPVAESYAGGIYIYSKVNTAITIPTIIIQKAKAGV